MLIQQYNNSRTISQSHVESVAIFRFSKADSKD